MRISFLDKLVIRTPYHPYAKKDTIDIDAIREAIYLASPALTEEIDRYQKGQLSDEKKRKKLQESIYKYYSRSCTRCTPFGLFAGIGTCSWGDDTNIKIDDNRLRETRLDMNYVCALNQYISSIEEIRNSLLFYPNNSIYPISDKIRYVDYRYIGVSRSHQISQVDHSKYLARIFASASNGAFLSTLATEIADHEISIDEATEFIMDIVNGQLLKSELEPSVTGDHYFDVLLTRLIRLQQTGLKENNELNNIINVMTLLGTKLKQLDEKFNNPIEAYKEIIEIIKQLPVKFEENTIFQTDLYLETARGTLNRKIKDDISGALNFLLRFDRPTNSLAQFVQEFYNRYEDAELPLLNVLDTESGIGYANNKGNDDNPLVAGIVISPMPNNYYALNYSNIDLMLHNKLHEAYVNGSYTVTFTDNDLKNNSVPDEKSYPPTFSLSFSIPAEDNQIILGFAGGVCAANLLGRFAGANKNILEITNEIVAKENQFFKNKIVAEIVHLPESRLGNILMRPAFREYEIPYLAQASVPRNKIIDLSDLYISVRNNSVVLRSKKLNKEIVPRLTNAHNFAYNALPVYQFLCDLQLQGNKTYFSFDWGAFSQYYKFKPRAVYGNVILKEASWDFQKNDIKDLIANGFNTEYIELFLEKWKMPRVVVLADEDNKLLVDWHNELSFTTFINTVKKRPRFTLIEHISGESPVHDGQGSSYQNEFIAFVVNENVQQETPASILSAERNEISRSFAIGSEWLYYKFYTGIKTADKVLTEYFKPVADDLLENGLIDKWFFIRYADPEKHLRIRLHIRDNADYGKVIGKIAGTINILIEEKLIWKIQTDTYNREIERYGGCCMEDCETYFWQDSVFVTEFIGTIDEQKGEYFRWLAGFRAVDELLNNFDYTLEEKKEFMNRLVNDYKKQSGNEKNIQLALDKKFRMLRKDIELNLNRENDSSSSLQGVWELLAEKTRLTKPSVENIKGAKQNGHLSDEEYKKIINSLIHMLLNRLFKSQQQMHELVIYNLLFAYYKSMLARNQKKKDLPVILENNYETEQLNL